MTARIDVPPGTVFGRLTVIEEARTSSGRRAMRCQCECGKQTISDLADLRAGTTKSCGCWRWEINLTPASRGEIPLYGKVAAGRVALIDEGDFDLVIPYRWNAREQRKDGRLIAGPYATTSLSRLDHGGKAPTLLMHVLIMGQPWVDHANGNGLDNRRSNLRLATPKQNAANRRMKLSGQSPYKGVHQNKGSSRWIAQIGHEGGMRYLGTFAGELSAAYAYDMAAREIHGEFAFTNFDSDPPQAVRDALQAEQGYWTPEQRQVQATRLAEQRANREPKTRTCTECGGEYQSTAPRSFYCGKECQNKVSARAERLKRRQLREQREDGRLF